MLKVERAVLQRAFKQSVPKCEGWLHAVGCSFIPCFYWCFVAFVGLVEDLESGVGRVGEFADAEHLVLSWTPLSGR